MAEEKFYSALHWAKKAEKSADLAKQYGNDKLNTTNITNCITEIPQDIKLELNNGTLTLKAGSKVYIPNGFEADGTTPKFDVVVTESDLTVTETASRQVIFGVSLSGANIVKCVGSETGTPVAGTYKYYYDSSSNRCFQSAASMYYQSSFPICICTGTSGTGITSIDQVFNGFGYIGSTVWVDKGVKGLIPNGRNSDGSLKNTEFTTQNILLRNNTEKGSFYLVILDGGTRVSIAEKSQWVFDEKSNRILGDGVIRDNIGFYGDITLATGGVITSFTSKLPFRAVDYSDNWGKPDYSAGIQGLNRIEGTYNCPAKGWILYQSGGTTSKGSDFYINGIYMSRCAYNFWTGSGLFPVEKGDIAELRNGTYGILTFFPCKGVN